MALGSLDSNGIGRYAESTPIPAQFSDYMNLALDSVSTAINNNPSTDSGWIVPTLTAGYTGTNLAYRKIGKIVYLRGMIAPNSGNFTTSVDMFTLPSGYRPAAFQRFYAGGFATTSNIGVMVSVGSNGIVSLAQAGSTATNSAYMAPVIFPVG